MLKLAKDAVTAAILTTKFKRFQIVPGGFIEFITEEFSGEGKNLINLKADSEEFDLGISPVTVLFKPREEVNLSIYQEIFKIIVNDIKMVNINLHSFEFTSCKHDRSFVFVDESGEVIQCSECEVIKESKIFEYDLVDGEGNFLENCYGQISCEPITPQNIKELIKVSNISIRW